MNYYMMTTDKELVNKYFDGEYEIVDDPFKEELIDWAENQEKRIIHYDDYIGDIEAPIDHIEMNQRDNRNPWSKIRYWHDKDGYDFTNRPFS